MQVTPVSQLPLAPLSGELTKDHDVPSQCSVRVWLLELLNDPTAQQSIADSHITEFNELSEFGSGEVIRDQVEPSQCTVSASPTAQQSVDEVQVTLASLLIVILLGVAIAHALPSHFSIIARD